MSENNIPYEVYAAREAQLMQHRGLTPANMPLTAQERELVDEAWASGRNTLLMGVGAVALVGVAVAVYSSWE